MSNNILIDLMSKYDIKSKLLSVSFENQIFDKNWKRTLDHFDFFYSGSFYSGCNQNNTLCKMIIQENMEGPGYYFGGEKIWLISDYVSYYPITILLHIDFCIYITKMIINV